MVVERDCTGGKADDIGDTCNGLLSSKLTEVFAVEATLELGVDGVTPVAETLPMNHDYEQVDQRLRRIIKVAHTGTHPRSPPTSFTA